MESNILVVIGDKEFGCTSIRDNTLEYFLSIAAVESKLKSWYNFVFIYYGIVIVI